MLRKFLLGLVLTSLVVTPVSSQSRWVGAFGGVTSDSTDTFTNKTIDANGTGNSLTNVDVADLATGTDGELITWNSSGNPAVVAAGDAAQVLTSNGAGAAPTMQAVGGAVAGYTATLADVVNTATETTMISFTVPANQMADGDMIQIWFHGLLKNNKGTAGTVTLSVDWGATSSANFTAVNQNDNAAEREFIKAVVMIRSGTDLIFTDQSTSDKGPYVLFGYGSWTYANYIVKATSVDFTVNSTVAVRVALSAAHATFYIKPQSVTVSKYEGST